MAKYKRFEELPAWQAASRLYNAVQDLLEIQSVPLSASFRNQLDRAALSVSNNIAEGFERNTTRELQSFLAIAKGSAGEVRSMVAVVIARPRVRALTRELNEISALAEECARQLMGWTRSIDQSDVEGKRHLTEKAQQGKNVASAAREYKLRFLKSLRPEHPLYTTDEARLARGEAPLPHPQSPG